MFDNKILFKYSDFLINASDKKIRLYLLQKLDPEEKENVGKTFDFTLVYEYQDVITGNQWMKCCFSRDGEYIVGGSAEKYAHRMYIWSKEAGTLAKLLETPKPNEGLLDLAV